MRDGLHKFMTNTLPAILIGFVTIISCLYAYQLTAHARDTGIPASPFVILLPFVGFALPVLAILMDKIAVRIMGFIRSRAKD